MVWTGGAENITSKGVASAFEFAPEVDCSDISGANSALALNLSFAPNTNDAFWQPTVETGRA
jgi:predicted trehalose synthase